MTQTMNDRPSREPACQRVLLVTGMSGAGKTTALQVLEDMNDALGGYYRYESGTSMAAGISTVAMAVAAIRAPTAHAAQPAAARCPRVAAVAARRSRAAAVAVAQPLAVAGVDLHKGHPPEGRDEGAGATASHRLDLQL